MNGPDFCRGNPVGASSLKATEPARNPFSQTGACIQSSFVLFYQSTISFLINAKLLVEWMKTKRFELS
jgi:hypothetical protein